MNNRSIRGERKSTHKLALDIRGSNRGVRTNDRLALVVQALALGSSLADERRGNGKAGGGPVGEGEGETRGVVVVLLNLLDGEGPARGQLC